MEMIVKIRAVDEDVEVLFHDLIASEITEKCISFTEFEGILKNINQESKTTDRSFKVKYIDDYILGYAENNLYKKYLINQAEHQRYVTWIIGEEEGGTKINFPNSLYFVSVSGLSVSRIEAYMYLNWQGKNTKLYKYAMPNMLTQNNICIGYANKEIKDTLLQTLEDIIYAPYSHATLSNVKGFSNTIDFFKFLEKNKIKKNYLYPTNLKLKDLVEEV